MPKKVTAKKATAKKELPGPVHSLPADFREALHADAEIKAAWDDLTPLARNEWICWVTSPKQEATRAKRIARAQEDLGKGKRRPCCWPGCPHRRESAKKWFEPKAQREKAFKAQKKKA